MPKENPTPETIYEQVFYRFEAWCQEQSFDNGNLRELIWDQDLNRVEPLKLFTQEELNTINYPNPNNIDYSEWTQPKWTLNHKPELQILARVFGILSIHSRDTVKNQSQAEAILLQDQALNRFLDWAHKSINRDITYNWSHTVLNRLQQNRY